MKHGRDSIDRQLVLDLEEVKALDCVFLIAHSNASIKAAAVKPPTHFVVPWYSPGGLLLGFGGSCPDPPSIGADHVGPVTTSDIRLVGEPQQAWREALHLRSGRVGDPAIIDALPASLLTLSA